MFSKINTRSNFVKGNLRSCRKHEYFNMRYTASNIRCIGFYINNFKHKFVKHFRNIINFKLLPTFKTFYHILNRL